MGSSEEVLLSKAPPSLLVYDKTELLPLSIIGTYTEENVRTIPQKTFEDPHVCDPPFVNAFFSLAPLTSVVRLGVFKHGQSGLCVGILLDYENGGRRSVGQCRVGVDEVDYYAKPAYICLHGEPYFETESSVSLQSTSVQCTSCGDAHIHDTLGWACFPVEGELEFWFSAEHTLVTVIWDDPEDVSEDDFEDDTDDEL